MASAKIFPGLPCFIANGLPSFYLPNHIPIIAPLWLIVDPNYLIIFFGGGYITMKYQFFLGKNTVFPRVSYDYIYITINPAQFVAIILMIVVDIAYDFLHAY